MPTGVTFVLRTFLKPPECAEDELPEANGKSGFGPGVAHNQADPPNHLDVRPAEGTSNKFIH
jgi:hypothetical protein